MGFGTLFVAFLLLISPLTVYTDLICALLAALALAQLGHLNRPLRVALFSSLAFSCIGLLELVGTLLEAFTGELAFFKAIAPVREVTVGVMTVFVLLGIRALAKEVGLAKLATTCECTVVMPVIVYTLRALLELPIFGSVKAEHMAIFAGLVMLVSFAMSFVNAVTVWRAYAGICMPEDLSMPEAPSRFAFVNRMREERKKREKDEQEAAVAAYRERLARKKQKKKKK